MKLATTAKLPKKTAAKVNDPDNPMWTEDMLGTPMLKRGRESRISAVPRTAVEQKFNCPSKCNAQARCDLIRTLGHKNNHHHPSPWSNPKLSKFEARL